MLPLPGRIGSQREEEETGIRFFLARVGTFYRAAPVARARRRVITVIRRSRRSSSQPSIELARIRPSRIGFLPHVMASVFQQKYPL